MVLLGLFLLMTGIALNVSLLRKMRVLGLTSGQVIRTWQWQASLGLVIAGFALVAASHA